jgi:hypothetical protein
MVVTLVIWMLFHAASTRGDESRFPLRNIVDFENQTGFVTSICANSWICYDFKEMRISLSHYSIRSRRDANTYHLRSWRLEGSIDGQSWTVLDLREDDRKLNSLGAIATFAVSKSLKCRMIRILQQNKNSSKTHGFIVNAIEFFGVLQE